MQIAEKGMKNILMLIFFISITNIVFSQDRDFSKLPVVDYSNPREYEIDSLSVTGVKYLQPQVLINISGFKVGQKLDIPGGRTPLQSEVGRSDIHSRGPLLGAVARPFSSNF